jgi:hypothetical protein
MVLRKDRRKFKRLPTQGAKYDGPNADEFCDFFFATAKPSDQIGWVNLFYINERKNQDRYNFEITYPFASKDYPTITRTYVVLRGDQRTQEPDADTRDPIYRDLLLTDHKIVRIQQPELDALFVQVSRTFERLPGPVITSYEMNQPQQVVTVDVQDVAYDAAPPINPDALTEVTKLERKTTAKATTTLGKVPSVFPDFNYVTSRDDAVIPYRHRKFLGALPSVQISQIQAGQASVPVLADVDWYATDHQITEFKHQYSRTVRNLTAPIALLEYRLTPEQQLSTVTETWAPGLQTIVPQPLLTEADAIQLGNNESIKSETVVPNVFPQSVFETEIPDPIPLKFRVTIPVSTTTQTSIGTAVPPVLGTGELSARDEQTKEFWHRLMTRGRDPTQLPVSLVSYDLTPDQQVSQIIETLDAGLQTLTAVPLLIKGSVDNLGNNTSLRSTTTIPDVFNRAEYRVIIPDPVPEKFKVTIPVSESALTSVGEAIPPVLGTGELERIDQQEKEFWHRVTVRGRNITQLPVSLLSYELTPEQQIETVIETLDVGIQTLSPNALLLKASVDNLGNNTSLKTTGTVPDVFNKAEYRATIPDIIPEKFRVTVPVTESVLTTAGVASPPVLQTGDLERVDQQEKEFWHRQTIRGRAGVILPVSLVSYEMTPDQQVGQVIETLATGLQTIAPDAETIKASVDNLGNNTSLKSVTEVPNVFDKAEYRITIPDPVPEKFKVTIPVSESMLTSAGSAAPPVLGTGELERIDQQEKEFLHRVTVRGRNIAQLPVSLLSYELTPEQQIGSVIETLDAGLQTLSPNALLLKASVDNLGNNTSLKSQTTVPDVFGKAEYRATIPDIIPEKFRVTVPVTESILTSAGVAAPPVLQTGDLERIDQQEKEFWHRQTIRGRAGITLPVSLVSYEMTPDQQVAQVVETLNTGLQTITPDATTVKASVDNLGNNTSLKSVTEVPNVFDKAEYRVTIPDPVPEKFKVTIPVSESMLTSAGSAAPPVLGTGELERIDQQEKEFLHRVTVRGRNIAQLPVSLLSYELTPEQQIGTVLETLDVGLQTLSPNALLLKASVDNLGNNTSLKSQTTIPDVFSKAEYRATIPDIVPEKFRVAVPVTESQITSAGTAVPPMLGTGDLERIDQQEKEFHHRLTIKGRAGVTLPVSLASYEMTPDQQVAQVIETLNTGLQTITPDATTVKASVDNLGNNTSLKSVAEVPNVFDKAEYRKTIPDIIPEKFRVAVPTTESSITSAGLATIPILATGDLERTDQQEKEFTHRLMVKGRAGVSLPVSLSSYKMSRVKQVMTVLETLDNGLQTIAPTVLTEEAEVTNLGNDTSLKLEGTVPVLFTEQQYEKSIPDLVPQEFRAVVPTLVSEELIAGDAAIPVLGTGDISHSEKQIDAFTYRDRLETRAGISLPQTLTNKEVTREFGGGATSVTATLANQGTQVLDEGYLFLKSEIKNLGNGMELKTTQKFVENSVWPILTSQLWDPEMRTVYPEIKAVVPAGTAPDPDPGGSTFAWLSEVKAIDKWRSLKTTTSRTPAYLTKDSALITYEMKPYRFPGYLQFSGTGYYTRAAEAVLVQHTIRTWWVKSTTTPIIPFDKIITGDVIINNLTGTGLEYARNVLHDGFQFGVLFFPATTPTATQYSLGNQIGTTLEYFILLTGNGTGYTPGNTLTLGGPGVTINVTILTVGTGGSIASYSPTMGSFPTWPVASTPAVVGGGSGTGAGFTVLGLHVPVYDGNKWIGNERVIGAKVHPEKEKNIWKIQTESVIME